MRNTGCDIVIGDTPHDPKVMLPLTPTSLTTLSQRGDIVGGLRRVAGYCRAVIRKAVAIWLTDGLLSLIGFAREQIIKTIRTQNSIICKYERTISRCSHSMRSRKPLVGMPVPIAMLYIYPLSVTQPMLSTHQQATC